MDVERWQKIKEIFDRAAEMSAVERKNFVAAACGKDAEMRLEIEKMLSFDDDDVLEINAFDVLPDAESLVIPEKIGKYKIIREIGRGGMGAVYYATRDDGEFKQKVAIKLIKRGMDSDEILRRFRNERQILAELQHPNVARLLDGGISQDGLPFYAMEYIEGAPIDEFCREKNLSEKLELFRQVCAAVSYAHANLVVHRDLKPSNILVTRDGTPKLLDFGIAKVLTPEITNNTETNLGIMTPAYASPEQIRGEKITTASDVYSLGVILYELLTGVKPYQTDGKSYAELVEAVCNSKIARPSLVLKNEGESTKTNKTTVADERLAKQLRGDLDNILLKALQKEPARRYQSVQEFSEDLRRHLMGLPIMARADTFSYRLNKFVRRNTVPVVAAGLIFLSLCAGITIAVWQTRRAEQQRLLSENRFNQVRQLANNVVFKYHDAIADLPGSTAVREMLVTDALKYLDALALESANDSELQKELALTYLKLGDVQGKIYAANTGNTQGALESYRKAVGLLENAVQKNPEDAAAKDGLIQAYDSLAFLMLRSGDSANSKDLVQKALNLHAELEKVAPDKEHLSLQLVELLIRLGDVTGNIEARLQEHLKALPLIIKLSQNAPNKYEIVKNEARVYQRIGSNYQWLGDDALKENQTDKAGELYRRALEFQQKSFDATQKLYSLDSEKNISRRYLAIANVNLAGALARNKRFDEALQLLGKAQTFIEESLRIDPKNKEAKFDLAEVFVAAVEVYRLKNDERKVLENYEKILPIYESMHKSDSQNMEVLSNFIKHLTEAAALSEKFGDRERSASYRRQIEELREKQEAFSAARAAKN